MKLLQSENLRLNFQFEFHFQFDYIENFLQQFHMNILIAE